MKDIVVKVIVDPKGVKDGSKKTEGELGKIKKEAASVENVMKKAKASLLGFFGAKIINKTVTGLVNVNKELFEIGVQAQGVQKFFDNIAGSSLQDLREATKGTVSDLQLMKSTVKGVKLGIDVQKMPELLNFARQSAKDMGEDVEVLAEKISVAIGRKSLMIMDDFGITANQLKKELNGLSVEAASVDQITDAVLNIAKATTEAGAGAMDSADAYNVLTATIENAKLQGGEMLLNSTELKDTILELTDSIVKNAPSILTFITDWGVGAAKIAKSVVDTAGEMASIVNYAADNPIDFILSGGDPTKYKKLLEDSKKTAIQLQQDVVQESKKAWKDALDERDAQTLKIEEKEKRAVIINKKSILDSLKLKEEAAFAEMDRQKKLLTGMLIMDKNKKKADEAEKKRQEELNALKLKGEQDALNLAKQKKYDKALAKHIKPLTEFDSMFDIDRSLNKGIEFGPAIDAVKNQQGDIVTDRIAGFGFGEKSGGLFSSSAMKMDLEKNQELYEQLGDVYTKNQEYLDFTMDMDSKVAKIEIDAATRQAEAAELTKQKMYEMSTNVINSMNGIYNVMTNESLNAFGKGTGIIQSLSSLIPDPVIGGLVSAGAGFLGNVFGQKEEEAFQPTELENTQAKIKSLREEYITADSSRRFQIEEETARLRERINVGTPTSIDEAITSTENTRSSGTISKQADTINNYYSFTNQVENLVGSGGMSELAQIITAEQKEATASFA